METLPNVLVLGTGGTIANAVDYDGYLPTRDLVDAIPGARNLANIEERDVASTGSSGITFDIWERLHDEITSSTAEPDPPDGIVITHGSNTVEETAYFLHLTVDTDIPIVLTAAQRNHGLVGNDGDTNFLDAVRVAGSANAHGKGVMIVINEEIHSARDVTKVVGGRPDGWSSGNLGVLGIIDSPRVSHPRVSFYRNPERSHTKETEFSSTDGAGQMISGIEIIYSAVGMDGSVLEAVAERGAKGIVLAALPTGTPARTGQAAAASRLSDEGVPVVLSHRGREGRPDPSSEFITADTLTPQKARILLGLALMQTENVDEIQRMFETY